MGDPLQTEEGLLKCQETPRGVGETPETQVWPKSWLPVHRCRTEIQRQSLVEREKGSFTICRRKGNTVGYCLKNTAPLSREEGEVL